MEDRKRVAVVLPAYNEADGLDTLIWRIARALERLDYVIVVVDDGSSDGTAEIAEALRDELPIRVIRHERNSGYGAGIRTGLLAAREMADVCVTMDADDSHDPALIPLMLNGIDCGADLIVASRFVPGGREIGVPFHRRLLSRGAAVVFGRLLDIDSIHDYTSGYRAYRTAFLDRLVGMLGEDRFLQETGFTVGVELLLKVDRAGGRIAELPLVLRYDRKRSASKLDIKQTMSDYGRMLGELRQESRLAGARDERRPARDRRMADGAALTVATDVLAVFLAFTISFFVYAWIERVGLTGEAPPEPLRYTLLATLFATTSVISLWRVGLYGRRLYALHLQHLHLVAKALTGSVLLYFTMLFFVSDEHHSRILVLGGIALSYPFVIVSRGLVSRWQRRQRLAQHSMGRALIYGAGWTGQLLMKKIREAPRLGTQVVGFLDDEVAPGTALRRRPSQLEARSEAVYVLGSGRDLADVAAATEATELFVALPDLTDARIGELRAQAEALGLDFALVPRVGSVRADQIQVDDLGAVPVLRLHTPTPKPLYGLAKRAMDLTLVVILAPAVIPLAAVTALAIKLGGGPVLFRQTRIGQDGKPFTVIKFRTMRTDADPYSVSPTSDRDPRLTPIGRIVRMAGLDEIPQLINVLRGEMSFVGPRPEMPQIAAAYSDLERRRLSVRPGISGLWQLSPDRTAAIHDNLEYDLYYLRQNSIVFDLLILGDTALFVLRALGRSLAQLSMGVLFGRSVATEADASSLFEPATEPSEFVFVALDQRKRPDEPPSWSRYAPSMASLGAGVPVKLLAARKNARRFRELIGEPNSGASVEYVTYGEGDGLKALVERASVVVTDVPHVRDMAAEGKGAVVMIEGTRLSLVGSEAGNGSLAEFVAARLSPPDQGLRFIQ